MKTASTILILALCLAVALGIAGIFTLISISLGSFKPLDITIGAIWFFMISFIVSMPLLIPRLRKRIGT